MFLRKTKVKGNVYWQIVEVVNGKQKLLLHLGTVEKIYKESKKRGDIILANTPKIQNMALINSLDSHPYYNGGKLSIVNKELPQVPGVYFLFNISDSKKELIYIGQTENIRARVSVHITYKKKFNRVTFILEDNPLIRKAKELIYCDIYKPKDNHYNNQYGGNI